MEAEFDPDAIPCPPRKVIEHPFTGKYWQHKEDGTYVCAACGQELFRSETKFDAGCGWPSFWDVADKDKVELRDDHDRGMHRIEVCAHRCGGHLGHLLDDGPEPTGQRYCINSASLDFKKNDNRGLQFIRVGGKY